MACRNKVLYFCNYVCEHKLLVDQHLSFEKYVRKVISTLTHHLHLLPPHGQGCPVQIVLHSHMAFLHSHVDYCLSMWSSSGATLKKKFKRFAMLLFTMSEEWTPVHEWSSCVPTSFCPSKIALSIFWLAGFLSVSLLTDLCRKGSNTFQTLVLPVLRIFRTSFYAVPTQWLLYWKMV